jgi:hypothetical protein
VSDPAARTADRLGLGVFQALVLLPLSVVAGWAAQAVVVACGLRLSGRAERGQAVDYDDRRAVEPGATAEAQRRVSGGTEPPDP